VFLQNKYSRIYFAIVNRAKMSIYEGYSEEHHIIPECMGGLRGDNLVKLTAREHFICHRLLVKMTTGRDKSKMALAVIRLSNPSKFHYMGKITGKKYEHIKKELSESKKGIPAHPNTIKALNENRNKNGGPNKGKKLLPETIKKIIDVRSGVPLTDEHKSKLSKALKGKTRTAEQKKNISNAYFSSVAKQEALAKVHESKRGKALSDEHKQLLSSKLKGKKRSEEACIAMRKPRPKLTCPHCNKIGGSSQMKRYHFDNCKLRSED
jgi:hypothetical protein